MSLDQMCSFNDNYLASKAKRDRVMSWLNQQKCLNVLLQVIRYNSNTYDTDKWSSK